MHWSKHADPAIVSYSTRRSTERCNPRRSPGRVVGRMNASAIHRARSRAGLYRFAECGGSRRQFPRCACASLKRRFVASWIVSTILLQARSISLLLSGQPTTSWYSRLSREVSEGFGSGRAEMDYLLDLARTEPGDTSKWDSIVPPRAAHLPQSGGRQKDIEVRLAVERRDGGVARITARVCRAVIEKWAPDRRAAAMTSWQ